MEIRVMMIVAIAVAVVGCSGTPRSIQTRDIEPKNSTLGSGTEETMHASHDAAQGITKPNKESRQTESWLSLAEAERHDRIRGARKRRVGDRVYVALDPTVIDQQDQPGAIPAKEIETVFRRSLKFEDGVSMVGEEDLKLTEKIRAANIAAGLSPGCAPVADVNVAVKMSLGSASQEVRAGMVLFEVTITSNYLPRQYTIMERGRVDDLEAAARLAAKVGYLLRDPVCVALPVDRNL